MATRIDQLATPKPNLLRFPDRRSVYWLDKLPQERSGTTNFELSTRWSRLTEGKRLHCSVEHSRSSPEWPVSAAALRAYPSERVCSLAQPRFPATNWQPDRPLLAPLSAAVQMAVASPRVCELAQPKRRSLPSTDPEKSTQLTFASSRIQLLAVPKTEHPQYLTDRPVSWPLSPATCEAVASERMQELSQPKPRRGLFEGYNPYTVSLAARAASASPRVQELSLPLPRKCRK